MAKEHSAQPSNESAATIALIARARRAWRIALIAYLIPITIATHWPRLGFPGAGMIDKFIHFIGFGMLAWIWMHAAPRGRALIGFAFAAAWVYIDERTQAIEILGRTFSGYDMIAGWMGVAFAGGIFACRWVAAQRRKSESVTTNAMMYASASNWINAALLCAASIVLIGGAMLWWDCAHGSTASYATAIYPIGFSGAIGVVLATMLGERRAHLRYAREQGIESQQLCVKLWPKPWAIGLGACLAWMLYSGYSAAVHYIFFQEPAQNPSADHQGFVVLKHGIILASVVFAFVFASMISPRPTRGTLSA